MRRPRDWEALAKKLGWTFKEPWLVRPPTDPYSEPLYISVNVVAEILDATAPPGTVPTPSNCMECANADSWGLPDKIVCRLCESGSRWEPLNTSSINHNLNPGAL